MPAMDSRHWRRAGYIPASDVARALSVHPVVIHRHMNRGRIPFQCQGRYRFAEVKGLIQWIKAFYTDPEVAKRFIDNVREAAKIKNDAGAQKE